MNALIIDLQETPSGGNSFAALGILARFITTEIPYQKHILPNEEKEFKTKRSWFEIIAPRNFFIYKRQVVILVNHWTGIMGEVIAIGFDAIRKGKIVGTKMAGLDGAINGFQTSTTKNPYSFTTGQLYHVNATAREIFNPMHLIDLIDVKYKKIVAPVLTEAITIISTNK